MFVAIAEALSAIRDNVDKEWDNSSGDAYALSSVCTNFDFIMTLVIVRNCLIYTRSAMIQLQGANILIIKGLQEIKMMAKSLSAARNLIDGNHEA